MTAHLLAHEDDRRSPTRRALAPTPFRLDWSEFWLLIAILGGMLALVGVVFLTYFVYR